MSPSPVEMPKLGHMTAASLTPVHYYTSPPNNAEDTGCTVVDSRTWRADLRVLLLKDVACGSFGTRQHRVPNSSSPPYTIVYHINMEREALQRFACDPFGILDDENTPTLFEVFQATSIWISPLEKACSGPILPSQPIVVDDVALVKTVATANPSSVVPLSLILLDASLVPKFNIFSHPASIHHIHLPSRRNTHWPSHALATPQSNKHKQKPVAHAPKRSQKDLFSPDNFRMLQRACGSLNRLQHTRASAAPRRRVVSAIFLRASPQEHGIGEDGESVALGRMSGLRGMFKRPVMIAI